MTILIAALLLLFALLACAFFSCRRLEDSRTVTLHVPREQAWAIVQDFAALHAHHARGRPALSITETIMKKGDDHGAGSVWRQVGTWGGREYWADLEITRSEPPRRLAVRLIRDSLRTERGLAGHQAELRLDPDGASITKLTWSLQARLGALGLLAERLARPERLRARLLDLGLRSVKVAVDGQKLRRRSEDPASRGAGDTPPGTDEAPHPPAGGSAPGRMNQV